MPGTVEAPPSRSAALLAALLLALGSFAAACEGDGGPDDDHDGDHDDDDTASDDDASDDDAADDDTGSVSVTPPGYTGTNGFSVMFDDGNVYTRDGVVDAWANTYGQVDLRLGVLDDLELHVKGPTSALSGDVEWASNQNDGTQVILVIGAASGLTETFGTTFLHPAGSGDTGGTGTWSDSPEASGHTAGVLEGTLKSLDGLHYAAISAAFDTDVGAH